MNQLAAEALLCGDVFCGYFGLFSLTDLFVASVGGI